MSSVQELKKMFENRAKNQNGPPIQFGGEKPQQPKQPQIQKITVKPFQKQQIPKQTKEENKNVKVQYEEPRMSVADLKKNLEGKLNLTGNMPVFLPPQQKREEQQPKKIQEDKKFQVQGVVVERVSTFVQSKELIEKLHQKIRQTNLNVTPSPLPPPPKKEEAKIIPQTLQPNFTKKNREESYIDVRLKKQDELSIQQRTEQVLYRIFGKKEQEKQIHQVFARICEVKEENKQEEKRIQRPQTIKPSQLRLRGKIKKGKAKRNLGSFDDQ